MDGYLSALHQFLTSTGHISHSHVVTAAMNREPWAVERTAALQRKFEEALWPARRAVAMEVELSEETIGEIAEAVVDEIENRGAAMQALKLQVIESESTIARQGQRIAELEALVNALRCGDLHAFHDGELSDERAAAYRLHLATCTTCASELLQLMQLQIDRAQDGGSAVSDCRMEMDWTPRGCTAAIACPREDCGAARGERCKTDRPLHVERWDAWKAAGFTR